MRITKAPSGSADLWFRIPPSPASSARTASYASAMTALSKHDLMKIAAASFGHEPASVAGDGKPARSSSIPRPRQRMAEASTVEGMPEGDGRSIQFGPRRRNRAEGPATDELRPFPGGQAGPSESVQAQSVQKERCQWRCHGSYLATARRVAQEGGDLQEFEAGQCSD